MSFLKQIEFGNHGQLIKKQTVSDQISKLSKICLEIRKKCLELAFRKNPRATHFGGAMSSIETLVTLYFSVMRYKLDQPDWINRDRFFLSKGHSILGYYCILNHAGFLTDEDLWSYGENGTILPGHPIINVHKGIEFTNGSLGMGLSVAIGNALVAKKLQLDTKCYVLLGDGECNEGSVWEACMSAAHHKLNNITAIVDRNCLQQTGTSDDIMGLGSIGKKFSSFGWEVFEVNGHSISELIDLFNRDTGDKPKVIIAKTVKGKGFSFSEQNNAFHHGVITKDLYRLGIEEIENSYV